MDITALHGARSAVRVIDTARAFVTKASALPALPEGAIRSL